MQAVKASKGGREAAGRMGEEVSGSEKLDLAPKVLQKGWGSATSFFKALYNYFLLCETFRRTFSFSKS